MTDGIVKTDTDDGQSIPAALAAKPALKKPRVRAAKVAKPDAAVTDTPPAALAAAEPVTAVTHEPVIEVSPEPVDEPIVEPVIESAASAPEPEAAAPEPEPVPTPPAAVPAEPQKEIVMATTIENATTDTTAKAQAFFSDANERAKGAVAKSAKLFEDANAFGKGNVEALVESSKIAAKGFETIGQDAAEFTRKSFEEATTAFKTLASVKSPTEFLKLHSDYVRQSFDSLVAESSRSTETMLKLAGEVAQPISNRFAVAVEKLKPTA